MEVTLLDDVKDELAAISNEPAAVKKAQAATMIRFGGGLHLIRKHIVIEAQFDNRHAAQWLKDTIETVYGDDADLLEIRRQPIGAGIGITRYSVRVLRQGGALALQTGLLNRQKRPVRGLPVDIVDGDLAQAKAAWRGAFLAHGTLSDPGASSLLEIVCPGYDAASDLARAAKRLKITANIRQAKNTQRIVLRDPDLVEKMLLLLGAERTSREWSGKRMNGEARGKVNRLVNFDDANMRRSAKAAVEAIAKVKHAFKVLGDGIPENLRAAGQLRLDYPDASLEELGKLADPPITKDAIAGRIRRLFQLSERAEVEQQQNNGGTRDK